MIGRDSSADVSGHSGGSSGGILDGRGHTIRHLTIHGKSGYDAGLFAMVSGIVRNLHLADVWVSGSPAGALAGLTHRSLIEGCSATGQVSGAESTGGLVGNLWDGTLKDCSAEVQVTGGRHGGGLVGGVPRPSAA